MSQEEYPQIQLIGDRVETVRWRVKRWDWTGEETPSVAGAEGTGGTPEDALADARLDVGDLDPGLTELEQLGVPDPAIFTYGSGVVQVFWRHEGDGGMAHCARARNVTAALIKAAEMERKRQRNTQIGAAHHGLYHAANALRRLDEEDPLRAELEEQIIAIRERLMAVLGT